MQTGATDVFGSEAIAPFITLVTKPFLKVPAGRHTAHLCDDLVNGAVSYYSEGRNNTDVSLLVTFG